MSDTTQQIPACEDARPTGSELTWTPHPLVDRDARYRRLTAEQYARLVRAAGPQAGVEYFQAREKRIADSNRDPFRHEFPLPHWAEVESVVLRSIVTRIPGGNNPGKSRWAASFVMRVLLRQVRWENMAPDKVKILMIAQDDDASRMFQQDKVYAQLPAEWRGTNESVKKPPGFAKCINYSDKNGFTEGNFVLPRPLKGQCWFKTVAQYIREPSSFEGPDYDLVIIDEGCPLPLLKSLRGRVAKRGGKIVYLLTCVNGYDAAMGQGLEGARLLKTLPMNWDWLHGESGGPNPDIVYPQLTLGEHQTDLLKRIGCPAGHMPYLMQSLNPSEMVIFMWNVWNPFQPRGKWNPKLPAMMDSCVGDPKWKVIVKMFGWIERLGQLALGNFNPEVHVKRGAAREALDALVREGKATVYMSDDPETQRSHAILWLAVFAPGPAWPKGLKYLFDESPRIQEGEWVNGNGERGDGQYLYRAVGSNWYKRYVREREREWNLAEAGRAELGAKVSAGDALHECVVVRRGDPRGFATEESTATGTRSLFELYLEDHKDEHPDCYPMVFTAAKIRRSSSLDIDILIDLLKFDEERMAREGGLTAENTPQLVISERCENFIRCALNYTLTDLGKSDEDSPWRDFIDSARYLVSGPMPHVDRETAAESGGGAWG